MPPPWPNISLLDSRVHIYPPGGDTAKIHGRLLTSGPKLAVGFKDHEEANSVVQGLELGAHVAGETDLSFVTLRGSKQYSCILTVDKNLILIASGFLDIYPCNVYLIYDSIDNSLRMIPPKPVTYPPPIRTPCVLVARRHGEDGGGDKSYALVFPGTARGKDVLFLTLSSSTTPWKKKKKAKFPDHSRPDKGNFVAEDVFSFRGRAFWVDLLCGILYCDCSDIFSDDIEYVHIRSFDLPVGCKKYSGCREDVADPRAFRNMGPAGESIKFVSIDGYLEHVDLTECKVRVWRLMEDMNWAVEYELNFMSLWDGVEFKGDSVPWGTPMYPFFSTEEDDVIYLPLGKFVRGVKNPMKPSCCLRVDLHSKTINWTSLNSSQGTSITSHLAGSGSAADKLLRGSYQPF